MSQTTETHYYCDDCGKKLRTDRNNIAIVTSKSEDSYGWSRLEVTINHHHGSHNDGETDKAELCKPCVIKLLQDALNRIKKGERVSAGVDSIDTLKFDQPF